MIPYLRAHVFDGFGCAALFGLAFGRLRDPMPDLQQVRTGSPG